MRNSIGVVGTAGLEGGETQGQGPIVSRVTFLACGLLSGCHPHVMTAGRRPPL